MPEDNNIFHPMPHWRHLPVPQQFTYPFAYTPTPQDIEAATLIRKKLEAKQEWRTELENGKMIGILTVMTPDGTRGFLSAFSGTLGGKLTQNGFVPPLLNYEQPDGTFKKEETEISKLNAIIYNRENSIEIKNKKAHLTALKTQANEEIQSAKTLYKTHKAERDKKRTLPTTDPTTLIKQSQFEKAEIKRLQRKWDDTIDATETEITDYEAVTKTLKQERKQRSEILQRWLFSSMRAHSSAQTSKTIWDIFRDAQRGIPPSGAGECTAPRLLNYALTHNLRPLTIAEFWIGKSPKGEIRIDGQFYPACQTKCGPILRYMLKNFTLKPNPLTSSADTIKIIYEDNHLLIVNKPAGLTTLSSNPDDDSLLKRILTLRPTIDGPAYTHRLDMATSGIVIFAKDKTTHLSITQQFEHHTVKKRYVAILEGVPKQKKGTISLPLTPNISDRPRQMVDYEHGKEAVTYYEVVATANGRSRVLFYPKTGRTHQLRVHAASTDGLACPIVGDNLYGKLGDRLMLHADLVEFLHPTTGEKVRFEAPPDF